MAIRNEDYTAANKRAEERSRKTPTDAKAAAARENGRLGGRPRKAKELATA